MKLSLVAAASARIMTDNGKCLDASYALPSDSYTIKSLVGTWYEIFRDNQTHYESDGKCNAAVVELSKTQNKVRESYYELFSVTDYQQSITTNELYKHEGGIIAC